MQKKKNLLYIFADQWRYHAVGAVREDTVFTPNMDAFAQESVCCTNAVSTYPLCSPHRAALLTGKYPLSCGMWTNCKTGLDISPCLAPQEILISDVLKKHGYDTAYIGKWHLDSSDLNYYARPESGCIDWDAYTPPGCRRHGFDFWYSYGAMDNHLHPHYWTTEGRREDISKWSVEHETDILLSYLEDRLTAARSAPFCAFVSWNPPHPPYDQVPDKHLDLYNRLDFRNNVPDSMRSCAEYRKKMTEYYAAVSGLDEQFARIMSFLDEKNLKEDTLIVLSADHGDCMGSHGLYGKNVWYEESIRIPLYVGGGALKAAAAVREGRFFGEKSVPVETSSSVQRPEEKPVPLPFVCSALIESCDHMPTLLDLLDIPVPPTVEGVSAADALVAAYVHKEYVHEKKAAFLCMLPGMPELIEPFKKEGLDSKCYGWRGVRTAEATYVIDNGTAPHCEQRRLLYDNVRDPYQLNPVELAADDPRCEQYESLLRDWCFAYKDFFLFERG